MFSLAYCSNWESNVRRNASISGWCSSTDSLTASIWAKKSCPVSSTVRARARRMPSTNTFTVPSGSFNTCNTWATVPIACRSLGSGSSVSGLSCASKNTGSSLPIAASSAAIDLGRPTNSGSTMCGYTTTSRRGKVASALYSSKCLSVVAIFNLYRFKIGLSCKLG